MRTIITLAYAVGQAALACTPALAEEPTQTIVVTGESLAPLDRTATLAKAGTKLDDLPRSVQIVPRELIDQQGAVLLKDALRNVSGLSEGGNFAFGFYDRFSARGLPVSFLIDGLPDTTSDVGGYVHSLVGVERVEVLKGPGSALLGATQVGGSINLVRYQPGETLSATASEQYGSFKATTSTVSLNVPLSPTVSARIDGQYLNTDGYRGLGNQAAEFYGSLAFRPAGHDVMLRLEYHELSATPDAVGLPFSPPSATGLPAPVNRGSRYYTPFAFADQWIKRVVLSDAWTVNNSLTVNLRAAYSDRDVDLARNAGGTLTLRNGTYALTGRQLRAQTDGIHDFVIQAEPTWHFRAGAMPVTLLLGVEARKIDATSARTTADLPNIADIYAPVTPETGRSALTFLCNSTHSCNNAKLEGRFYGVYGIGQFDLSDRLKVRLSARQNWFRTSAEGRSVVPLNPGSQHVCSPPRATACPFIPGEPVIRHDRPLSWDVGALYRVVDAFSIFGGYSSSTNPLFNTEETQSVGQVPDKGTQLESGVRIAVGQWLTLTSAVFWSKRDNVFVILAVPDPAGTGNLSTAQVYCFRTKGWENDLTLHPVPPWTITGNLTLQDAKITDYPQSPSLVGNRVQSVPNRIANVWTSYDIGLPGRTGFQIAAGVRYRSAYFGDAAQTRILPGSTQFDASGALVRGRLTARIGIRNIFDAESWNSAGVGGGAIPGPGRTFFVSGAVRAF